MKKYLIIAISIFGTASIGLALAGWNSPLGNPPNNNADTPINVGVVYQIKQGGLALNTEGSSSSTALLIPRGNVGIGVSLPSQKLEISGNIKISGSTNGIIFSNNSKLREAPPNCVSPKSLGWAGGSNGNWTCQ